MNDLATLPDADRRQHLRLWAGGALLGMAAPLAYGQAQMPRPNRVEPPSLRLITPMGQQAIGLKFVDIQAEVVGRTVATRIEIHLYNPNPQVLEAELQFPLLDGQVVTGFALDIQGQLRQAVPVDKARGREVFEAIVRRGVDPGLLEATQGNHHKLRVYPLPPHGIRKVVLELSETLASGGGDLPDRRSGGSSKARSPASDPARSDEPSVTDVTRPAWRLPLRLGGRVELLQISVTCVGLPATALTADIGSESRPWADMGDGNAMMNWSTRDHVGNDSHSELRVQLPLPEAGRALVSTQRAGEQTCFYAELLAPAAARVPRPRARPAQVTLWWDASGSGAGRDHALELAWLDAWLQQVGSTVVHLVELRDVAQPPRRFEVRAGVWGELHQRLSTMVYDGASQLGDLRPVAGSELGLLVSDGLGNYGGAALPAFAAAGSSTTSARPAPLRLRLRLPLLVLCATPDADTRRLRRLAESSGGACIDLLALNLSQALDLALHERCRLLGLSGRGVTELEGAGQLIDADRFVIAGQLTAPRGEVDLLLQMPGGARQTLTVNVTANGAGGSQRQAAKAGARKYGNLVAVPVAGVAATRWAQMRLATLDVDPKANRAAIRRLGQQFGLVTRETSLIVLETIDDYARHEIEPPADMRDAWLSLRSRYDAMRPGRQPRGLPPSWQERQRWWATDYSQTPAKGEATLGGLSGKTNNVDRMMRMPAPTASPDVAAAARPGMPTPAPMAAPFAGSAADTAPARQANEIAARRSALAAEKI